MPARIPYPPLIRPKNLRGTVPTKAIRKAVRELVAMRKNDPIAYEALIKKNAHRVIRIVPG
jgi:bifunctional N-acetylglucosamine-1-phosphate-uridyltransferase/glucosamine-1-phosphate-acetyltransferase GlmU-like protein